MKLIFLILIGFIGGMLSAQSTFFTEVSSDIGVDYIYPGGDSQEVGAGVTVLDVNGDGWDDFFQAGGVFKSKLWINKKGKFVDATEIYGLAFLDAYYVQSAIAGDINNDGYEDLFICNYGKGIRNGDGLSPVMLLNNKGKGFVKVMESVFSFKGNFSSGTFGDFNNDGYVDLYLADYVHVMNEQRDTSTGKVGFDPECNPNRFFINVEGKSFREVRLAKSMRDYGCGLSVSFTDYDNDNDMDLILLNDFGGWNHKGNLFFKNNYPDSIFTEESRFNGFYQEIYGMGVGVADFDTDGDLDYYITNIGHNFLFENDSGIFKDRSLELKLDLTYAKDSALSTSWSGLFFDYDNDLDLDLYVSNGNVYVNNPVTAIADANQFFLNEGNKGFTNVSSSSGVDDILSHRGAALLDYDHDGDLDIISSLITMEWSEFGGVDQKIKVYRNNANSNNNWIGLKLVGGGQVNNSCLGCSITMVDGEYKIIKEVDGAIGHGSQSSRVLYFGLGDAKLSGEFEIQWLGGGTTKVSGLKAGKVYSITEDKIIKKVY